MEKGFHTGLTPYRDTAAKENANPGYYSPVDFGQFDSNHYGTLKTISDVDEDDAESDFHPSPVGKRLRNSHPIMTEIQPALNNPASGLL